MNSNYCWRLQKLLRHHMLLPSNKARSHLLSPLHRSGVWLATSEYGSDTQQQIKIPKRIPRSPTAILEALADTVDYDRTDISQHRLIDDPGTLSYDRRMLNRFVISEESGRKAAQYAMESWPQLLQHSSSEPSIEALTPPMIEKADTEECFNAYISLGKINEAREIYQNLITAGSPVSTEMKLLLLDVLCRYNCKDTDYYKGSVEKFYQDDADDHWRPDEIVDELFVELSDEHPQTYISLICGMCKYKAYKQAHALYTESIEKDMLFPLEVHNTILRCVVAVFANLAEVITEVEKILSYMERRGIRPNLETFNNILRELKQLPVFTKRYAYSLKIMREMKQCGIEPSAASYMYLLDLLYRSREPKASDVLKYAVEKFATRRETHLRDPEDVLFPRAAMAAALKSNDITTAHKLYHLIWKGRNKAFLGGSYNIVNFHDEYLMLSIRTEPMDEVMKVYTDIVPRCLLPKSTTFSALFEIIDLYDGHHFLPQIYNDAKFGHYLMFMDYEKFTELLTVTHAKPKVFEDLAQIADDIYKLYETRTGNRIENIMSSRVYSHFIQLALNMKDIEKAWEWFERYQSIAHYDEGMNNPKALLKMAEALMKKSDFERMATVLGALLQLGFDEHVEKLITQNDSMLPPEIRNELYVDVPKLKRPKSRRNNDKPEKREWKRRS